MKRIHRDMDVPSQIHNLLLQIRVHLPHLRLLRLDLIWRHFREMQHYRLDFQAHVEATDEDLDGWDGIAEEVCKADLMCETG